MQDIVEELADVLPVREGQLRETCTAHKLQRDEKCYYEAPGRLLKYTKILDVEVDADRNLITLVKDGVRSSNS